mgnify:CR=1 FL=1
MNGDMLTKNVIAANDNLGSFTLIFDVLGVFAQHGTRINLIAGPHFEWAFEDGMRANVTVVANHNRAFDDHIGPDDHIFAYDCLFGNQSRGVNPGGRGVAVARDWPPPARCR